MVSVIVMDQPFAIRITMRHDEVRQSKFRIFMAEEDFKYNTVIGYEHVYYTVHCDNLMDGAKIETYLSTEPWTPANILQDV